MPNIKRANTSGITKSGVAIADVPDAPIIGSATAGFGSATVAFTAAPTGGAATTFTAISSPGSFVGTSSTSPITVSGLTAGTSYSFTVRGSNSTGTSAYSSASNSVTPLELTGSYDALATVTLSSSTTSVTFTGIPSDYKHLQIKAIARTSRNNYSVEQVYMRLNSDSGGNYAGHQIGGDGTAAYSFSTSTSSTYMLVGQIGTSIAGTNTSGVFITDILDYTSLNKNKTIKTLAGVHPSATISGTVYGAATLSSGLWMNSTNSISSITLFTETGTNFTSGSFALYGVK